MIKEILLVGLGGGIGSIFRYLNSRLLSGIEVMGFPLATFCVNMIGCFLIGLLIGFSFRFPAFNPDMRIFLTIGFCGGFTTFSTFSLENVQLFQSGNYLLLALYVLLSVIIGCLAVWAGLLLGGK